MIHPPGALRVAGSRTRVGGKPLSKKPRCLAAAVLTSHLPAWQDDCSIIRNFKCRDVVG